MGRRSRRLRTTRATSQPAARGPALFERFSAQAAALATLVLLAYWNSLGASFHFDDWSLFGDPYVAGPGLGLKIFRLGQTRPLTYWTFHVNHLAGGLDTWGYHLVNVLLHAANSVLVLWIARRHLPLLAAFLAAGLFAAHPLQTEAVSYIFARSSLLAAFFALLCFVLFLQKRYAWSVAAFLASLLAKEESVALPAFLLLYDYLFVAERDWRAVARRGFYYAGLLLCAGLVAARLFYVLATIPDPGVGFRIKSVSAASYALTQARVIWRYLRLVILPLGQNLDYDFPLSTSLLRPPATLPAVLALLGVLAALLYFVARRRAAASPAFWLLGFFVLVAPTSGIVAQSDVIYEHRTYLPMTSLAVGLAWLAGRALARIPGAGVRAGVVAAVIGVCAVATMARNEVWATEYSLWSDVVRKSPNKGRPYIGLSRGFAERSQFDEARRALERGAQNDPRNHEIQTNLGVMALQRGEPQVALEKFRRAMELNRETPEGWNNIGAAHHQLGNAGKAVEAYRRALALDGCFFNAHLNLARALSQTAGKNQALQALRLPAGCRLLPEQDRQLEELRAQLGR